MLHTYYFSSPPNSNKCATLFFLRASMTRSVWGCPVYIYTHPQTPRVNKISRKNNVAHLILFQPLKLCEVCNIIFFESFNDAKCLEVSSIHMCTPPNTLRKQNKHKKQCCTLITFSALQTL